MEREKRGGGREEIDGIEVIGKDVWVGNVLGEYRSCDKSIHLTMKDASVVSSGM